MTRSGWLTALGWVGIGILQAVSIAAAASGVASVVDYDIVYVRQLRLGDDRNTIWPEVFRPGRLEPGADLVLLRPDGSERVLVEAGPGAVTDPCVSFDAEWVYYSYFPDVRRESLNKQRWSLPDAGADIYRIHLESGRIEQLTHGEFTPNTGAGRWNSGDPLTVRAGFNRLGYGVLNLGGCPVAGGRVVFTSNRNGFEPPKGYTAPTMQLFVMDQDGSNVEAIGAMNLSSALHPIPLRDGRVLFSSHESQGLRDKRLWGIWAIRPDGRQWQPLLSAFRHAQAFHFATQLSDGDVVVVDYYNLNNNGFGALYRIPIQVPAGTPLFGSPIAAENSPIEETVVEGHSSPFQMSFTPWGLRSLTPFTHGRDKAAPIGPDGRTRVGKFTQPAAAPGNDLLVVWTPGPATDRRRPTPLPYYDAGIYLIPRGERITAPDQLVKIKNDPRYNEAWPRAIVSYLDIYGVDEPKALPWLPNDGSLHPALPAGTPYGLVGSSSLVKRGTAPGSVRRSSRSFDDLDAFNTTQNSQSSNWKTQGAEAGRYSDDDIWAVRILAMEPSTHRSYGPNAGRHFFNHASERLRILGEIPVRKLDASGLEILDSEGHPDTSFLAKIPADTPFTFQTLDRKGMLLNMSQTWHQLRPGEVRTDCGGCHAHSQLPLAFETTAAARPGAPVADLAARTPLLAPRTAGDPGVREVAESLVDVEFLRDVRPLLERSCVSCHTKRDSQPPGNLVLDDREWIDGLPGDYYRLAADSKARFGHPPVIANGRWRQTNASRYLRKFQSRRSLLVWTLYGERLDGWSNGDHPTETVPGDASTLPVGASANAADLDFVDSVVPHGVPPLSEEEKLTIVRWIDLGAPIDLGMARAEGNEGFGWFLDDLRPVVTISAPRAGHFEEPVNEILFGAADANSGLDRESIEVEIEVENGSCRESRDLSALVGEVGEGIFRVRLPDPIRSDGTVRLTVAARDVQGNWTAVERTFTVSERSLSKPRCRGRVRQSARRRRKAG